MGVRIPNPRGHAKAWESISPTPGATPKRGSPYPQLEGPHRSLGVRIPNSRGHAKAWESVSPTRGATPKHGSQYPQLEGPRKSVKVGIPNLWCGTLQLGIGTPTLLCSPSSLGYRLPRFGVAPQVGDTDSHASVAARVGDTDSHAWAWKERRQYRRSPMKEVGAALGPGFCSECRIFTSQQTTFVSRPVLLIFRWKALRNKQHLYSATLCQFGAQKHGWFDEKEAYTKKKGGRHWRHVPNPLSLKNPSPSPTRGGTLQRGSQKKKESGRQTCLVPMHRGPHKSKRSLCAFLNSPEKSEHFGY